MEGHQNSAPARALEQRIIKRYSNRKLYDTRESRYVTLQQIGEMVRAGEDVRIVDNKTKEDKTEATLALIISEDLKTKQRSVPLGTLRTLLQERGERILSSLRGGPIGRFIPGVAGEEELEEGVVVADPAAKAEAPMPAMTADETQARARGRLNELVETSRHTLDQLQTTIDERVRGLVPGLGLLREIRADIDALRLRVEAIERALSIVEPADPK